MALERTTQSPYQAFNRSIWQKMPKRYYLRHVLEIGVASAVINFNDGVIEISRIFQSLDLLFRKYIKEGRVEKDINRIIKLKKKIQEVYKSQEKEKICKKGLYK